MGREARATPPSTSYLASATAAAAAAPDARRAGAAPSLGDAGLDAGRLPAGLPAAELCALPLPRPLDDMATTTTETRQKSAGRAALLLRAHAVRGERGKESAAHDAERIRATDVSTRSFASGRTNAMHLTAAMVVRARNRHAANGRRSLCPTVPSAATVPVRLAALTFVQRRTRLITHSSMRFDCCSPSASVLCGHEWRWKTIGGGFIAVFRPFDSSAAKKKNGSAGRTSRETTAKALPFLSARITPFSRTRAQTTAAHSPHTHLQT